MFDHPDTNLLTDLRAHLITDDRCHVCKVSGLKEHGHSRGCLAARVEAARLVAVEPAVAFHLRRAVEAEHARLQSLANELHDMGLGDAAREVNLLLAGLNRANAALARGA